MKLTRQFDQMDCGPACIRMVASHYGRDYPLSYLRTLSHLTREGVSVAGIRDALKQIGMESASFEMTAEQLRSRCPLPAILYWDQNHFVVLYGVTRRRLGGGWCYRVANPAYGKRTFSDEALCRHWLNGTKGVVIAAEPSDAFYARRAVKEKHSFVRFAWKYVWPFRLEMVQMGVGMLAGIVLSLVTPFLTQTLVDDGIGMRDLGLIGNLLAAQLFLFAGSFAMGIVGSWVSLYMGTRINIHILHDYLSKLLRLPMTFFETKSVGDYQQRLGDHSRLQSFVTQGSMQTFFSLLSAPVLLVVIGFYSMKILLAYLLLTALSTAWMAYFFHRRKALDYEQFRLNAENQNQLYELMSGITDIKLNAYEAHQMKQWTAMQERRYRMSQKVLRLGQVQQTGYTVIGQVRNILITFWIAAEVVHGNLTLGMMMSISNIIGQVGGPLSQLIGFLQQFQDAKISLERSEEVHLCPEEDAPELRDVPDGAPEDIELRDVTFRYAGSIGPAALEGVSLCIPRGRMTAIVGESGSGKTTLMKLLLKFYAPTAGTILLGGADLQTIKAHSIRCRTGIVMQEGFLFSATLRRNIILGEEEQPGRLDEAIAAAQLSEYVRKQPLGVETKVGRDGIGVSGGERQRIMIARAVYKRPLYLMLDEATSSLDAENERLITENLSRLFAGRTMLVIAHRLSTVRNADQIIVLRHGHVVETGKHDELVARRGYYYELIKNQLELADGE